jgi:hypothetical protein
VGEEDSFQFGRCNLKALVFDEFLRVSVRDLLQRKLVNMLYLLPVHNVD